MSTMKQVALQANVSLTTVSHVINNKGNISEDVREKVWRIIEELNYKPNKIAQSLARNSARCIGFYGEQLENFRNSAIMNGFIAGILSVTTQYHYNLIVYPELKGEDGKSYISLDNGEPIDGAIITNPRLDSEYLNQIIQKKIPFVLIGRPGDNADRFNYVDSDNLAAGYSATRHLISMKHTKILFVNGPQNYTVSIDRLEGYKMALEEAGIPFVPENVRYVAFNVNAGLEAVKEAKQSGLEFSAILAGSDSIAIGAIGALHELELAVPKEISLVCLGETVLTTTYNPQITGVEVNGYEVAVKAARQLLDVLDKKLIRPSHSIVPCSLNIRDTVGLNKTK